MDKNFVLPETEKSLNMIIAKITRFFDISSVCISGFYAAYTIFRIFFMPNFFILNLILSVVSWAIFVLVLLEFFKKIHFNHIFHLIFEITRRVIISLIFVIVFISLFSSFNELLPYKVLFTMFCGVGLIISIMGDIFNATIPAWTKTVLDSFKSDIELSGLAERSLDQLKEELKKDDFKEKIATGAIYAGSSIVRNVFKNIFKGRGGKDDK